MSYKEKVFFYIDCCLMFASRLQPYYQTYEKAIEGHTIYLIWTSSSVTKKKSFITLVYVYCLQALASLSNI